MGKDLAKKPLIRDKTVVALRFTDAKLEERFVKLANELNLSSNMAANMLIAYAFNEVDRSNKKFRFKTVLESE